MPIEDESDTSLPTSSTPLTLDKENPFLKPFKPARRTHPTAALRKRGSTDALPAIPDGTIERGRYLTRQRILNPKHLTVGLLLPCLVIALVVGMIMFGCYAMRLYDEPEVDDDGGHGVDSLAAYSRMLAPTSILANTPSVATTGDFDDPVPETSQWSGPYGSDLELPVSLKGAGEDADDSDESNAATTRLPLTEPQRKELQDHYRHPDLVKRKRVRVTKTETVYIRIQATTKTEKEKDKETKTETEKETETEEKIKTTTETEKEPGTTKLVQVGAGLKTPGGGNNSDNDDDDGDDDNKPTTKPTPTTKAPETPKTTDPPPPEDPKATSSYECPKDILKTCPNAHLALENCQAVDVCAITKGTKEAGDIPPDKCICLCESGICEGVNRGKNGLGCPEWSCCRECRCLGEDEKPKNC